MGQGAVCAELLFGLRSCVLHTNLTADLVCPDCHGPLFVVTGEPFGRACDACTVFFPVVGGVPYFAESPKRDSFDASFQEEWHSRNTLRARLYRSLKQVISGEYAPNDTLKQFLDSIPQGAVVAEFGSGARRLRPDILNLDLFPSANVDLVADIEHTPLPDNSVDAVVLESVIEHVPNPQGVVDEIRRVLKPGGQLLCINPWMFPYHGYPANYCNFSKDGIERLLRDYSLVDVKTHFGPTSMLINTISEYVAIVFGRENRNAYLILKGGVLALLFPLKYIDKLLVNRPESHRVASMLSAVATK